MDDNDGIVREFLTESFEQLDQADLDLVALETRPQAIDLVDRVFRVIHTIKGTCGFLGFATLEGLTHSGETLLSRLRDGDIVMNAEIANGLLAMADAIRAILSEIDATGSEGDADQSALVARIEELTRGDTSGGARDRRSPTRRRKARATTKTKSRKPAAEAVAAAETMDTVAPDERPGAPPDTANGGEEPSDRPIRQVLAHSPTDSSVRVDVHVLDRLMDLVGELVLTRNEVLRLRLSEIDANVSGTLQHLNLVTSDLQEGIMKTRMQPVAKIWGKFPRLVRDLASACGKQARLEMEGQGTELDRSLIEAIRDPLTHLVRNAIDHGIEAPEVRSGRGKPLVGSVWLRAFPEGGQVNIEISDDGGGIDPERIKKRAVDLGLVSAGDAARLKPREVLNLIFLPGFSTAQRVTNLSGRGVGMDVVKTNIEKVNGLIDISSDVGRGTTVRIKIPLTLAIIPALITATAGERHAIPQNSVVELVRLESGRVDEAIEKVHGAPVYRLRGKLLPIVELRRELALETAGGDGEAATIVVLQADDRLFGLLVDAVVDTQEIVVKPLGALLERLPVFVGATIMGDGNVALILDVLGLAQRAHVVSEVRQRPVADDDAVEGSAAEAAQRVIICRSPDDGRMAIPLSRVARLESLSPAGFERIGGRRVVQYRGDILPLVDIWAQLPERRQKPRTSSPGPASETIKVVVYSYGDQQVGLVVAGIVDIVEEVVDMRPPSRDGVLGCAILRGKITEFIDVEGLIEKADLPFLGRSRQPVAEA